MSNSESVRRFEHIRGAYQRRDGVRKLFSSTQPQKHVCLYRVELLLNLSQRSIEFAPIKGVSVVIENKAMGDEELVEIEDSASEMCGVLEKSVANSELVSR